MSRNCGEWLTRLVVALSLASELTTVAAQQPPPPLIVFVCEHGSAKSLLALSVFERLAKEQGLAVRALSRGTSPDASVPPAVVDWLRGDGFDVASFKPRPLQPSDVAAATRLVAIGVDLGPLAGSAGSRLEKWDDIPPFSESYSKSRDALVSRAEALVRELVSAAKK